MSQTLHPTDELPDRYHAILERVIEDGISAAKISYANDAMKSEGAVAGFEACRGKTPQELEALLIRARQAVIAARREEAPDYWKQACFSAEVEWTCNCISCYLVHCGRSAIYPITARAMLKVADIMAPACNAR